MNNTSQIQKKEADYPLNELVLIDDDSLTIDIVSWIINKSDFQAKLFVSPGEALKYLEDHTPRLLVVDFYMPGMTGLEFISSAHDSNDLAQTQIFLCSAVRPPRGSEQLLSDMGVNILEKQCICDRTKFIAMLSEYLDEN